MNLRRVLSNYYDNSELLGTQEPNPKFKKLFAYINKTAQESIVELGHNIVGKDFTSDKIQKNRGVVQINSLSEENFEAILNIWSNRELLHYINHIYYTPKPECFLYANYGTLSRTLSSSPLNTQEKYQVIKEIIRLNYENLLNPSLYCQVSDIGNIDILKDVITNSKLIIKKQYGLNEQSEITAVEFSSDQDIIEKMADDYVAIDSQKKATTMLTIGELLKKETFQIEEIDTIIKCLKEFHLSDELCSIVKYRLDKKQERPVITSRQEQRQEPKPQISAKENKAIWHELMQYFDFDKMQSIKYLTQEEISRCLELLTLVNIPLDRQKVFLEIVLNSNPKFKIDPIEEYNDLLNKIQNYSENIELNDLNTLKECLEEMRTSNSEEKVFYRQMFIETFKNIIDNIPKDGSYELSLRANKPMI